MKTRVLSSFVGTLMLAGLLALALGLAPNASRWGLPGDPPPEPSHLIIVLEPAP
jgi:hypothetical protein